MFRIIPKDQFITSLWKNGGGVTQEIVRDAPDWSWRMSIAEVGQDGPFSIFPKMSRILTVLEGAGLDLHHASGVIAARPFVPVHFSGEMGIEGRLIDGPVRDFNVIYDSARYCAEMRLLRGGEHLGSGAMIGVLALQESVCAGGLIVPEGGFALGSGKVEAGEVEAGKVGAGVLALSVIISPR